MIERMVNVYVVGSALNLINSENKQSVDIYGRIVFGLISGSTEFGKKTGFAFTWKKTVKPSRQRTQS
jgi:hypothetical protein